MTTVVESLSATDPDSGGASGPVRTCIGCRRRVVAVKLLRVVVAQGAPDSPPVVVPDPRRRAPGRGAWLHSVPECVDLAERRRAYARALRVPGQLDSTAIREYVASHSEQIETPTGGTPQEM